MGTVYKVTNIKNNKIYIGKTSKNIEKYISNHFNLAFKEVDIKNNSYRPFYNAIREYGKENFIYSILVECDNNKLLNILESFFIQEYDSCNPKIGYNIGTGGKHNDSLTNHPNRNEIIEKSRIGLLKYYEKNPEKKQEISERQKERYLDERIREHTSRKTSEFFSNIDNRERQSILIKKAFSENPLSIERMRDSKKSRVRKDIEENLYFYLIKNKIISRGKLEEYFNCSKKLSFYFIKILEKNNFISRKKQEKKNTKIKQPYLYIINKEKITQNDLSSILKGDSIID
jgi:hypothetical protein